MKRTLIPILFVLSLAITFSPAAAANLAIVTSSDTFVVGDSIQLNLIVSDLTAGGPPSVGEFDIDITFEPELAFKSYEFGNFLGNPNDPTETNVSTDRYGPYFNLYEESLLSPAALDSLQPASFTLATITFIAEAAGISSIEGDLYALLDAVGGDLIEAHGPVTGAEVMINPVPIPSAILLLGSGMAGLAALRRKRPMKHTQEKKKNMTKSIRMLPVILAAAITFTLGTAAPELWASGYYHHKPKVEKLEEADIYFELNNTDGDLGIHGKIDGGPWTKIWINDSYNRQMMKVTARGRLKAQAVTELFFESAEPTFDKLDPADFFKRFPEGIYKIYGLPQDGKLLFGESEIRHVMPAPPDGIEISGTFIDLEDVDCEEEAPVVEPEENGDVIISWDPVTTSHPALGAEGDIEVSLYQLVVEMDVDQNGHEFESVMSINLPPDVTSMTVPAAFINLGLGDEGNGEYKFEILVKEKESGNQTITEGFFCTGPRISQEKCVTLFEAL